MNKKTRLFLLVSALTLSVGLCTGLLAYYGGLPTLASSREVGERELLERVPAQAILVAYANVHDVMASEFRQHLKELIPDHDKNGQDEFQRETGIDVENDIDSVLACVLPGEGDHPSGFVMLRGRFDFGRLEAKAREHKDVQVETFAGARIVRLEHGPDGKVGVLASVEPGLLMFGEEGPVKRALSKASPSITTNDEMMGMIGDVEGNANLWAVGRVEALAKNTNLPEQIATQLPSVKWFSASSRINGGLAGTLRAEARDDEAAKNLRDVLQGFLALAKMQAGNKPELQSVFQSIQLSGTGTTVALSFQVPSDFINTIAAAKKHPANQ